MKRLRYIALAIGVGILGGLSVPGYADDTEIYLRQATSLDEKQRPNILFILDRSGSMSESSYNCLDAVPPPIGGKCSKVVAVDGGLARMERLKKALTQLLQTMHNVNVGFMTFQTGADPGLTAVHFPIAYIDAPVTSVPNEEDSLSKLNVPISSGNDDAAESSTGIVAVDDATIQMTKFDVGGAPLVEIAQINRDSDDLVQYLGGSTARNIGSVYYNDGTALGGTSNGDTVTGLEFNGINIPKNAVIQKAELVFTANANDSDSVTVRISGVDSANPPTVSSSNTSGNNGLTTGWPLLATPTVDWAITNAWTLDQQYSSPDVSSIVKAIQTKYWTGTGNDAVAFRITRTPALTGLTKTTNATAQLGKTVYDYASSATKAVQLRITYAPPALSSGTVMAVGAVQQITTSTDDASELISSGKVTLDDSIYLGNGTGSMGGNLMNGFRFSNLPIPPNAKILSANIQFTCASTSNCTNNPVRVAINAQNADNAATFVSGSSNKNISNRTLVTTTPINWDIAENLVVDDKFSSPDFSSLVQTVVNRTGWVKGSNALVITAKWVSGTGIRRIYAVNNGASKAPILNITWEAPSGGRTSGNQTVGLRFQGVGVPRGAPVTTASIVFNSGKATSDPASVSIKGEKSGDSSPFDSTTSGKISSRTPTSTGITWSVPAVANQASFTSPELKTIVQEIVNQSNWCGGNAMTFMVAADTATTPNPLRNILAYESGTATAPTLKIEFDINYLASNPNACMKQTASVQVMASTDDVIESTLKDGVADGSVIANQQSITASKTTATKDTVRIVGLRFQQVPINAGSTVSKAKLIFNGKRDVTQATDAAVAAAAALKVSGEKNPESLGFPTDLTNHLKNRPKTASVVNWDVPAGTTWTNGQIYESPDLTAVVQEIVSQGGWQAFNDLSLFVEDRGSNSGSRQFAAFDSSPVTAPILQIEVLGPIARKGAAGYFTSVRERLLTLVSQLHPAGGTPLVATLFEATEYFTGGPVVYGTSRNNSATSRSSHPGSWTINGQTPKVGVDYIIPPGCDPFIDPWNSACAGEKIVGSRTGTIPAIPGVNYIKPTSSLCQGNYIIFLTDGAANDSVTRSWQYPQTFLAGKKFQNGNPILTNGACGTTRKMDGINLKYYWNGTADRVDQLCGPELIQYLANVDLEPNMAGLQNVIVNPIGFNLSNNYGGYETYSSSGAVTADEDASMNVSNGAGGEGDNQRGENYLKEWAFNSVDPINPDRKGKFYSVSSAQDLVNAINTIITDAMTKSTSFAAPSVSVSAFNRLFHGNEVYFALFKPDRNQRWHGNIKKFTVREECPATDTTCKTGDILDATNQSAIKGKYISDTAVSYWTPSQDRPDGSTVRKGGAGVNIPLSSTRKIYTYVGDASPGASTPLNFDLTTSPVSTTNTTVMNALPPDSLVGSAATGKTRNDLVNWILGQNVMNEADEAGIVQAERWKYTDSLHSSPVAVTYGTTQTSPTMLFSGTNDGLIHMFDASNGVEQWAFLPQEMFGIQPQLMQNNNAARIYGIDAPPTVLMNSAATSIKLFFGMRSGGKNLYALNVSDRNSPKLMWVIKGGASKAGYDTSTQPLTTGYDRLAYTWSAPRPTKVNVNACLQSKQATMPCNVLLFGGGFNDTGGTTTEGNAIFMVDPDTGKRLWWASGSGSGADLQLTGMDYPIPSELAFLDVDGDGTTDRIYVGDLGGQVWRIDLGVGNSKKGIGGRLATLADTSTTATVPDNKRKFFYPPEIVRLKDKGYDAIVITSGNRDNPLGTGIRDQFYVLKDRAVGGLIEDGTTGNAKLDACSGTASTNFCTIKYSEPSDSSTTPTLPAGDLYNATSNVLQDGDSATITAETAKLEQRKGWYINLQQPASGNFIGEKGLASPIVLDRKVYFTTYTPPETNLTVVTACSVSGEGKSTLYALNLLDGGAVYPGNDPTKINDPNYKKSRVDRSIPLRDGITSDIVPMFLSGGDIRLLSNDLSLLRDFGPVGQLSRTPTFWMQDQ